MWVLFVKYMEYICEILSQVSVIIENYTVRTDTILFCILRYICESYHSWIFYVFGHRYDVYLKYLFFKVVFQIKIDVFIFTYDGFITKKIKLLY